MMVAFHYNVVTDSSAIFCFTCEIICLERSKVIVVAPILLHELQTLVLSYDFRFFPFTSLIVEILQRVLGFSFSSPRQYNSVRTGSL